MIHIDYDSVHRLIAVRDLVELLRHALAAESNSPARTHYELESGSKARTLLLMPAWRKNGALGVKISTVFSENARQGLPSISGVYVLFSGQTGEPKALIDGRALTLMRTAAVSALAADLLAPARPRVLLMVGTGALVRYLIEGHMAVRNYSSVLVWGRAETKARVLADALRLSGISVDVTTDLQAAAGVADVISCATMSERPLIHGEWLKPVCHLDLVGSYKPNMRETDDECYRDAHVVIDSPEALEGSGDLIGPLAGGALQLGKIDLLTDVIARQSAAASTRTVFKSVGIALADLVVAERIVHCLEASLAAANPAQASVWANTSTDRPRIAEDG